MKVRRNLVVEKRAMETKTATKSVVVTLAVAQTTLMKGQMVVRMAADLVCNVKMICQARASHLDTNNSNS